MALVAKQTQQNPPVGLLQRYTLYNTVVTKDINNNDVTILQSIGDYSLTELQNQKESLLNAIADIDSKIAAINSIVNV